MILKPDDISDRPDKLKKQFEDQFEYFLESRKRDYKTPIDRAVYNLNLLTHNFLSRLRVEKLISEKDAAVIVELIKTTKEKIPYKMVHRNYRYENVCWHCLKYDGEEVILNGQKNVKCIKCGWLICHICGSCEKPWHPKAIDCQLQSARQIYFDDVFYKP